MLLCLYQIFIFLLGHRHFFLHFFFAFMENLFKKHPKQPLFLQLTVQNILLETEYDKLNKS